MGLHSANPFRPVEAAPLREAGACIGTSGEWARFARAPDAEQENAAMTIGKTTRDRGKSSLPPLPSRSGLRIADGVRLTLSLAATAFGIASLIHGGVLYTGHEHANAETAEGVIAVVLIIAILASWIWPAAIRAIALSGLGFALLGTLAGVIAIAAGVGPQSMYDIIFHTLLIIGLLAGLGAVWRLRVNGANSIGSEC
jgi:hypothetical protein